MGISFHFIRCNIFIWRLVVYVFWNGPVSASIRSLVFGIWVSLVRSWVAIVSFIVILVILIHYCALHSFERLLQLSWVLCWTWGARVFFLMLLFHHLLYLILDGLTNICSLACLSKQYTTVSYFLLNMKLHIGTE